MLPSARFLYALSACTKSPKNIRHLYSVVLWHELYAPNGFHDGWYEAYALLAIHGVCWLHSEDISMIWKLRRQHKRLTSHSWRCWRRWQWVVSISAHYTREPYFRTVQFHILRLSQPRLGGWHWYVMVTFQIVTLRSVRKYWLEKAFVLLRLFVSLSEESRESSKRYTWFHFHVSFHSFLVLILIMSCSCGLASRRVRQKSIYPVPIWITLQKRYYMARGATNDGLEQNPISLQHSWALEWAPESSEWWPLCTYYLALIRISGAD